MTNEIKNVPELRFPGFEGEWILINLKNCFHTIKNGFVGTATPFYTDNSGVRYLQSNNVKNGFLNDNVKIYVTKEFNEKYKSNQLKSGDMLMVQSGHAGATAVVSDAYEGSNCHALIIMKPKSNINTVFLNNYFQSGKGVKSIYSLITGNTIKHILSSDVKKITFSTPVIGEQEKIGDFFNKLDRQIELEEQKLAKLEEQKKGYMQKIFSQELRFKDGNGNNYSEWIKTNLKFLVTYKNGKGYEKEVVQNGKYNIINLNSISTKGMLKDSGKYSDFEDITLKKNDLIMILSDVAKGNLIGKTAIIDQDDKYLLNQRVASLRIKDESISNVLFIYYFINYFRQYFINMSTGMSQLNINKSTVEDFLIYLPYIEEQDKIGNFFSNLDKSIIKQLDKIELLKERKKGFLQKMFV